MIDRANGLRIRRRIGRMVAEGKISTSGRTMMAVVKMGGRTYDMLVKDKRVKSIKSAAYGKGIQGIVITLADGWQSNGCTAGDFPDWEAARNWVRKAVKLVDA